MRFTRVNTPLTLAPSLCLQPHPRCLSIKTSVHERNALSDTGQYSCIFAPSFSYTRNPNNLNLYPPAIASVHYFKAIYLDKLVDPPTYCYL